MAQMSYESSESVKRIKSHALLLQMHNWKADMKRALARYGDNPYAAGKANQYEIFFTEAESRGLI